MSSSSRSVHAGDPPDVSPPKSSAQCPASALPGSGKDQVGPVGDSVTIPVTVDKQLLHEIVGRQGTVLSGRRRLVQTSSSLFALRKNHLPPQLHANAQGFSTGQSYDYATKYDADEWGHEMLPESRFYKTYVDESDIFDADKITAWRDALDVLLIIIGLFSAIVTTFVIQTSQALQPDYGQLTAVMVYNLILVQQSLANNTFVELPIIRNPLEIAAAPSNLDVWVNGMWFTSLAISLSTALLAMLTKQWLYHYTSQTAGSSQERARLRQFRFAGLEKYHVPMIIGLLPFALHLSLALFLTGLALFLSPVNLSMAIVVGCVSGAAYIGYITSVILPLFDPQCPYQSPVSGYLYRASIFIQVFVPRLFNKSMAILSAIVGRIRSKESASLTGIYESVASYDMTVVDRPYVPPTSLKACERLAVSLISDQIDVDAVTWLYSTSSNSTVRNISFQAVVGLPPSDADTTGLVDVVRLDVDRGIRSCTDVWGDVWSGRETDYHHLMQAICIRGFEVEGKNCARETVDEAEQDGQRVFNHLILPALRHGNLKISDFIAPGPRAHVCLPLSVWSLCITLIKKHPLEPVFVAGLLGLDITTPPTAVDAIINSSATLTEALHGNPHLQSLLLNVISTNIPSITDVRSLRSISALFAIQDWALLQLDNIAQRAGALSLLTSSLEATYMGHDLQLDFQYMIHFREFCSRFFAHELVFTDDAWGTYCAAVSRLYWSWDEYTYCPEALFLSLLAHLNRTPPAGTTKSEIETSLWIIPHLMRRVAHPEMFYNKLREQDALPLMLEEGSYRAAFWERMWRFAVFSGRNQLCLDTTTQWVVDWIEYIDCPERLFMIFRGLLQGERTGPTSLLDRVTPLLAITGRSANWAACFEKIVGLLNDRVFLDSIQECEDPRNQFANLLVHMWDYLPNVTMYSVQNDKDDKPITAQSQMNSGEENLIYNAIKTWEQHRGYIDEDSLPQRYNLHWRNRPWGADNAPEEPPSLSQLSTASTMKGWNITEGDHGRSSTTPNPSPKQIEAEDGMNREAVGQWRLANLDFE